MSDLARLWSLYGLGTVAEPHPDRVSPPLPCSGSELGGGSARLCPGPKEQICGTGPGRGIGRAERGCDTFVTEQ